MNLQSINTYVKKARKEISALNKRIGRNSYPSSLYSYLDFGWCLLRYGCTINQYANGGFYRLRSFERKQVLTYRGLLEFIEKCNETSHIRMIGRKIPYWEELKKLGAAAHKDLPQIKFIGWDGAITENGRELIEGNHHPDYDLLEFVGQRFWWSEFKKYLNL